jgi:hypothetical protein
MYLLDIRIKRHHRQPMTRPGIEPGIGLLVTELIMHRKQVRTIRYESVRSLCFCFCSSESRVGLYVCMYWPDVTLLSMYMAVISYVPFADYP